ncbi:MarR family winged helix-turn-helix transcriptional regulator [Arthrobacter monumenti]
MRSSNSPSTSSDHAVGTAHIRAATDAWESLFRAQVSVMRLLQADAAFRNLNMREYDVLFNLSRCPTGWLRLNDLNALLLMSQPSLSRMVDRLEARGLLDRKQAPEDHRGVLIGLTQEGAELQKTIGREHVRSIGRIVGGALSPEELTQLQALTMKLRASIR